MGHKDSGLIEFLDSSLCSFQIIMIILGSESFTRWLNGMKWTLFSIDRQLCSLSGIPGETFGLFCKLL